MNLCLLIVGQLPHSGKRSHHESSRDRFIDLTGRGFSSYNSHVQQHRTSGVCGISKSDALPTPERPLPNEWDVGRIGSSLVRLDLAGASATLGLPAVGDEVLTIVGPSRRVAHEGLALAPGFRLGHYEVIDALGSGGMATVLKARDLELGRIVALKILPPESALDPDSVTRFKQEARAAAKLDHDNVARVFFYGEDKGLHFIAFEFVEGETLRVLIERHVTLPPADCIRYLIQLAAGLQHASDRGVIHRDVKPSNIVITPDGKAKIIDMGLARQQGSHSVNGGVTQSGMTLGTFDYISPEQALDPRSVDVRSDIYSLGCAFYHALTGRPPVPEGTAAKKLHAHQHEPPTDPRQLNPRVPDALAVVLSGMMVKDRARRYASPEALIRDLQTVADTLGIPLDPNTIPTLPARDASSRVSRFSANPRPRVSPGLVLGIGVALIAAVVLALSLSGRSSSQPAALAWDDESIRPDKNPRTLELVRPNPSVPKVAAKLTLQPATTADLIAALSNPNVAIQLVPDHVYDLSTTVGVLFQGKELDLETPAGLPPATLKLAGVPESSATLREGSLTLSGVDSVRIRGVRFVIAQKPVIVEDTQEIPIGLLVDNTTKLELLQCQFELASTVTASDGIGVVVKRSNRVGTTDVKVRNATVALRNWTGFELSDSVRADFHECGVMTSRVGIALSGDGAKSAIELQFCTFLLENRGIALEVHGSTTTSTIQAGFSVFASGNTDPPAMMMPESNERRPAMLRVTDGASTTVTAIPNQPNAFYRVDIPSNWDAAIDLKTQPWANATPAAKLDTAEPWKAFELNPNVQQLRVPNRGDIQILGVKHLPADTTKIYATWPPSGNSANALKSNVKVWYPNPTPQDRDSLPANVFEDLDQAMAALKPGDQLLIRGTGVLEVPTLSRITKPDFNVTIRPEDEKNSVILTPGETKRLDSAMFWMEEGRIRFERIEFRLKPKIVKSEEMKSQAVVALAGGRGCEFHKCIITMDQRKSEVLSAVALVDLSAEMSKTDVTRKPVIRMEDCVLRGGGRAVWAASTFPFDFNASNVLFGLDAPLVELDAPAKSPPSGAVVRIDLTRVTAWLGAGLLELRCGKALGDKPGPFVPVSIRTDSCLFATVPESTSPFALVTGGDSTLWDRYVTWDVETASGYGNFPQGARMLEVSTGDYEGKAKRVDIENWLQFTNKKPSTFGKVTWKRSPEDRSDLITVLPDDATVKSSTFAKGVGCRILDLPTSTR